MLAHDSLSSLLTLVPLKAKDQWNEAVSSLESPAFLNGYHNKEAALSCQINFLGVSALPEILTRLVRLIYNWTGVAYNCDFANNF